MDYNLLSFRATTIKYPNSKLLFMKVLQIYPPYSLKSNNNLQALILLIDFECSSSIIYKLLFYFILFSENVEEKKKALIVN